MSEKARFEIDVGGRVVDVSERFPQRPRNVCALIQAIREVAISRGYKFDLSKIPDDEIREIPHHPYSPASNINYDLFMDFFDENEPNAADENEPNATEEEQEDVTNSLRFPDTDLGAMERVGDTLVERIQESPEDKRLEEIKGVGEDIADRIRNEAGVEPVEDPLVSIKGVSSNIASDIRDGDWEHLEDIKNVGEATAERIRAQYMGWKLEHIPGVTEEINQTINEEANELSAEELKGLIDPEVALEVLAAKK